MTTTTGLEFKRFYLDSTYWPEDGNTYHDDVLLHVDGRDFPQDKDPADIADSAVVEIRSGWVADIPQNIENGADEMSLEDYFLHWLARQSTATFAVECPHGLRDAIVQAITAAGGTVKQ